MVDKNDREHCLEHYHVKQLRFLMTRFDKGSKRARLNTIRVAILLTLERYEKEGDETKAALFWSLRDFIKDVKSFSDLERLTSKWS